MKILNKIINNNLNEIFILNENYSFLQKKTTINKILGLIINHYCCHEPSNKNKF